MYSALAITAVGQSLRIHSSWEGFGKRSIQS